MNNDFAEKHEKRIYQRMSEYLRKLKEITTGNDNQTRSLEEGGSVQNGIEDTNSQMMKNLQLAMIERLSNQNSRR